MCNCMYTYLLHMSVDAAVHMSTHTFVNMFLRMDMHVLCMHSYTNS